MTIEVDDPLVMDANYQFDTADRRKIDNQIRALQASGGVGLGTALQVLRTNAGGTATEWASPVTIPLALSNLDPAGATDGYVITRVAGVWTYAAPSGGGSSAGSSGQLQTSDGAGAFTAPTNVLAGANFVSAGASPAATGNFRLPNAGKMLARNAANSADIALLELDASDDLWIGYDSASALQARQLKFDASLFMYFSIGGTAALILSTSAIQVNQPIIGGGSSPFAGMNGMFVKAMTGSTYVLGASEYSMSIVKVTGTGTNVIKFPAATDGASYMKFVWNAGSGTLAVQDSNAVAAAATLAAGTGAWFLFATSAVKQMSAAFTVA